MGLVPGLAYQPSSPIIGLEQWVVRGVVRGGKTCLSDDEDAVEDAGSEHESSKRW